VSLDTGRENVVVISRHSRALRADIFRGFSRVELQTGSKVLLATLLITDDDTLVGPDDVGLSEPAFRRFSEPLGASVTIGPSTSPKASMPFAPRYRGKSSSPRR
jgi:thymidine phosphorylase